MNQNLSICFLFIENFKMPAINIAAARNIITIPIINDSSVG